MVLVYLSLTVTGQEKRSKLIMASSGKYALQLTEWLVPRV